MQFKPDTRVHHPARATGLGAPLGCVESHNLMSSLLLSSRALTKAINVAHPTVSRTCSNNALVRRRTLNQHIGLSTSRVSVGTSLANRRYVAIPRILESSGRPAPVRLFHSSSSTMSLPDKIHAIGVEKTGDFDVIQDLELPFPKQAPGDILIKVEYVGVNFIDTYFR
jgi:hypothetical protein